MVGRYIFKRFQQWFDEWRMVRRVRFLQRKGLWFSDLQGESVSSLPSIRIEYGDFNHEGRRVLDAVIAEFLMRSTIEEAPFSLYLEKAKELNDQLGLDGLKKLLLDNQYYKRIFFEDPRYDHAQTIGC